MAKRRLIKKINEVSDQELTQNFDFSNEPDIEATTTASSSDRLEQQEQEIEYLREQLESFRTKEIEFEKYEEENFRLSQQNRQLAFKLESNQDEIEELQEKNEELTTLIAKRDMEIVELQGVKTSVASTDSTVTLEEVNRLKVQLEALSKENSIAKEQISVLESAISEKEQELNHEIVAKEKEINELNEQLISKELLIEKEDVLETVKMELESLNGKLTNTETENQDLTKKIAALQEQIAELQEENNLLKDKEISLLANPESTSENGRLEELKHELESVLKAKSELEVSLGRSQGLNDKNSIQKNIFESELSGLREQYKEKELEYDQLKEELESLRNVTTTGEVKSGQLAELLQAKQQINDLLLKNQSLQEEALKSQQEIGEVMVSAKKEANRIISEAQVEAKHMINSAELEMLNIGNRAKNISNEVEESKNEIMTIYRELEERLGKLSRLDKTGN